MKYGSPATVSLGGTASTEIEPPPDQSETRTVASLLTEATGYVRSVAKIVHQDIGVLHADSSYTEWSEKTRERARSGIRELLEDIGNLGFAWRDIARLAGVSVPAVQKWRRGGDATGENRQRIAGFLAACDLISEHYMVQDLGSWFEIPLLPAIPLTPQDLWIADRPDLLFDFASGHTEADRILTDLDPEWRERYRSDFEAFRAADGQLSLRPKA